ncbi:RusA family crossover junction endodeoxyribonuclease [Blastochloris tepida]|uniref:Endonuclease n=1 Tax=Blastochloris tepida TaxID=2233851 RepID=A0A348FZD8_9HYPH|nr:RusA family crossover junction endodeoxyribonuclease [Blastochloris tepida]BBF92671.1 endonuclease [Blastochloris tepida]
MRLEILIDGEPVPWARARSCGKRRWTPEPQASYMEVVKLSALSAMRASGGALLAGPLRITASFMCEPPTSWSNKKRVASEGLLKITRPDTDNYIKLIKDALQEVAYKDDAIAAQVMAEKRYSLTPRSLILVETVPLDVPGFI